MDFSVRRFLRGNFRRLFPIDPNPPDDDVLNLRIPQSYDLKVGLRNEIGSQLIFLRDRFSSFSHGRHSRHTWFFLLRTLFLPLLPLKLDRCPSRPRSLFPDRINSLLRIWTSRFSFPTNSFCESPFFPFSRVDPLSQCPFFCDRSSLKFPRKGPHTPP